ncbi:SCO-spondin-like isoform X2 [Corticium candelabrum]|uniref:SCO-spondin-like isoform X2 n=1 Tax=Corticium candelabrum TaxID=121492 RepID=UPI002E258016|nr:SCO-spondin-like isoform X2 [Corticium candelabrum]
MMRITIRRLIAVICISLSFSTCESQPTEPGVCFDIANCDYTKGNPAADSLILYAECCDKDNGESLALSDGSCANCGTETVATTAPATNDTNYIEEWTPWRDCSQECGPGTRSRQKICGPPGDLKVCEVQDEDCNLGSCPVDGEWGEWQSWSACSDTCRHSRVRSCDNPIPSNGGNDCVGLDSETAACERDPPCPVHGAWSEWTEQPCSKSCGGGFRILTRECDNPAPQYGGDNCYGNPNKFEQCNTECCPIHGTWSAYTSWAQCEVTCGGGRRIRRRKCDNPPPSCNGRNCSGFDIDTEDCSPNECPVDGGWSTWSEGVCTKPCGGGHQQKFRKCDDPVPRGTGEPCPGLEAAIEACNDQPCPVDGEWSFWSSWSTTCPACGKGYYKNRTRLCDDPPPQNGGLFCPGPKSEAAPCSISKCPVNGEWSAWTAYTDCPRSCGGSRYQRTRKCDNPPPNFDGLPCPGDYIESTQCNTQECPVNGEWSYWTEWSHCSTTCDRGGRNRSRVCNDPAPRYNGTECPGPATEWAPCPGDRNCPVDGGWSPWSVFSPCTASCEGGTRESFRECNSPQPRYDGLFCGGHSRRTCECNKQPCPVDGGWTWWSIWSPCSSTCEGGKQNRTRECTNPLPRHGGLCCQGPEVDVQTCAHVQCPVDGNWGQWNTWSECSEPCETGRRFRNRLCNNPAPDFGGKPCNDPSTRMEEELCNTHKCPVNGNWGAWTEYEFCSKTCDTGSQGRTRECNNPAPKYDGADCSGNEAESRLCNKFECPVDGFYTTWTSWAQCSRTCGRGTTERTRHCNPPLHGGTPCLSFGLPQETKSCCNQACQGPTPYTVYTLISSQDVIRQRYTTSCGFLGFGRCSRTRTIYSRTYRSQGSTLYKTAVTEGC